MHRLRLLSIPMLLVLATAACRSQSEEPAAPEPSTARAPAVEVRKAEEPILAKPVAEAKETAQAAVKDAEKVAPTVNGKLLAKVGELAPTFTLKDLDGKEHALATHRGKYVVLEWFSPGCPYCQVGYAEGSLKTMPEQYMKDGIVWLSINSEAAERKAASAEENKKFVEKYGLKAPLLFDPTGIVGRSYGAKTTPHMFVIDPKGVLVYQGALDNAPMGKIADGTAKIDYVGDALAAAKAGRKIEAPETKSYG